MCRVTGIVRHSCPWWTIDPCDDSNPTGTVQIEVVLYALREVVRLAFLIATGSYRGRFISPDIAASVLYRCQNQGALLTRWTHGDNLDPALGIGRTCEATRIASFEATPYFLSLVDLRCVDFPA